MATILQIDDFKGFSEVKLQGTQVTRFDDIILENEFTYLSKMLGIELAELFRNDYLVNGGTPSELRFQNLLEEMNTQWGNKSYTVNTIKQPLALFIYSVYYLDMHTQQTPTGIKQSVSENSKTPTMGTLKHYNSAVKYAKAVQAYVLKNKSDYPEFRGERIYTNNPIW